MSLVTGCPRISSAASKGVFESTGTEDAASCCEAKGFDAMLFKAHHVEFVSKKEAALASS